MIVVSDTSPLNYLVLIGSDQVLPQLFGRVAAPSAVLQELKHTSAPDAVRRWIQQPPQWLEVIDPSVHRDLQGLGPGESAAILLAQELRADALLIDERDGARVARELGLFVAGTLAILETAAQKDLLSLPDAIGKLQATTFRGPADLIEMLLKHDAQRRK